MGIIIDWDTLIECYTYHAQFRNTFHSFLEEYFARLAISQRKFDWELVGNNSSLIIRDTINKFSKSHRALLEFGIPDQLYAGPFVVLGNEYEVEVQESELRGAVDLSIRVDDVGTSLDEQVDAENWRYSLEPKAFSLLRTADKKQVDVIANSIYWALIWEQDDDRDF